MSKKGNNRTPKTTAKALQREAKPRTIAHLASDDGAHAHPVFSFSITDQSNAEEWGWHLLTPDQALTLVNFIGHIGRNTWAEVRSQIQDGHKKHHYQEVGSLCSAAQARITKMKLADMGDQIFRFRIGPVQRLWGFEVQGLFYAVWWDPEHRVHPTERD